MDGFRRDVKKAMEKGGAAASGANGSGGSSGSADSTDGGNVSSTVGGNIGSGTTAYSEKLTSGWIG